jgi:uncharacterized protein YceK
MRAAALALALLLPCALAGCGTVTNLVPSPKVKWAAPPSDADHDAEHMLLDTYGGVKNDLWCIGRTWEATGPIMPVARWAICPILALDIPLSIVGDSLMLPITFPIAVMRGFTFYYFPPQEVLIPGWRDYLFKESPEKLAAETKGISSP